MGSGTHHDSATRPPPAFEYSPPSFHPQSLNLSPRYFSSSLGRAEIRRNDNNGPRHPAPPLVAEFAGVGLGLPSYSALPRHRPPDYTSLLQAIQQPQHQQPPRPSVIASSPDTLPPNYRPSQPSISPAAAYPKPHPNIGFNLNFNLTPLASTYARATDGFHDNPRAAAEPGRFEPPPPPAWAHGGPGPGGGGGGGEPSPLWPDVSRVSVTTGSSKSWVVYSPGGDDTADLGLGPPHQLPPQANLFPHHEPGVGLGRAQSPDAALQGRGHGPQSSELSSLRAVLQVGPFHRSTVPLLLPRAQPGPSPRGAPWCRERCAGSCAPGAR